MGLFKKLVSVAINPAKAIVDSNKKSEVQKRNDAMVCDVVASIQADYKREPASKQGKRDELHFGYVQARMYEAIKCKKSHTVAEAERAYGEGWKFVDLFTVEGRSIGQAFKQVAPVVASTAVGFVAGGPIGAASAYVGTTLAMSNKYKQTQADKFNSAVSAAVMERRQEDAQASVGNLFASGNIGGIPIIIVVIVALLVFFKKRK